MKNRENAHNLKKREKKNYEYARKKTRKKKPRIQKAQGHECQSRWHFINREYAGLIHQVKLQILDVLTSCRVGMCFADEVPEEKCALQ